MMYDGDAAFREIERRSETLKQKRYRRNVRRDSAAAFTLFTALLFCIGAFSRGAADSYDSSFYGASLLSPDAGEYVLISVIAFVLGVLVTALCVKIKDQNNKNKEDRS